MAASVWTFSERIDKLPVMLGALLGILLAVWMAPRRAAVPLASTALLYLVFLAEGAAGRVGHRPLPARRRHRAAAVLRRRRSAAGRCSSPARGCGGCGSRGRSRSVVYGATSAATTLSLTSLRNTLAYHEEFHSGLAAALRDPAVAAQLRRCPLLSLPNNKLIPDARWILDSVGQHDIVARSQARADVGKGSHTLENRIRGGSVAVYPLGSAIFFEAIVDVGDDPRDQVPMRGFRRIYTSRYYAVYGNC